MKKSTDSQEMTEITEITDEKSYERKLLCHVILKKTAILDEITKKFEDEDKVEISAENKAYSVYVTFPNDYTMDCLKSQKQIEEKRLYTPTDLISLLGLSKTTVYALLKMDGFPVIRINSKKYIPVKELDKWIIKNIGRSITFKYD